MEDQPDRGLNLVMISPALYAYSNVILKGNNIDNQVRLRIISI